MKFGTKAIHAGVESDPTTGAIMTPIYQTSTYVQAAPGDHKGYEYSRTGNPTRAALESALAELEGGKHGLCFSSGMAAADNIIKLMEQGDEVLCCNDMYGGTYRLFTKVYKPLGIDFRFIDMSDATEVGKHISPKTKMIWIESPTNPLLNIIDIKAITDFAKEKGIICVVDNTFATPYLQNPLSLGADIVMHSVTKYLGGHSDTVMGATVTGRSDINERLQFTQNTCGAVPGPMDSFLVLRGLKTLHVRMQKHCENGEAVANYLKNHPKVAKVLYPGLPEHANHEVASRQMKGFGGMVSFHTKNDTMEAAQTLMKNTKLFCLAESLGGVESLIGHPASMTHAAIPEAERLAAGLRNSTVRLSVGIEDKEDILADLEQALATV